MGINVDWWISAFTVAGFWLAILGLYMQIKELNKEARHAWERVAALEKELNTFKKRETI